MVMPAQDPSSRRSALAGQVVYSPWVLALYDWWVLGVSNRWIWRCPTNHLLAHFNRYVTSNHLDVGVGTGYFLDHAHFPSTTPQLALLDLNPTCLMTTATRVSRYHPTVYHANILEPLSFPIPKFDSISLNYVLHCLPGAFETKGVVFDHLKTLLNPGGIIFGSTLLYESDQTNRIATKLMQAYNARQIFSNTLDQEEGLRGHLMKRFAEVTIERKGYVALFSARHVLTPTK